MHLFQVPTEKCGPVWERTAVIRRNRHFSGKKAGAAPGTHSPFTQPERNTDSRAATETLCHINTDSETPGAPFHYFTIIGAND